MNYLGTYCGLGDNLWLTPFWVMLFDAPPPGDLTSSIATAIWSQQYFSVETMLQIVLPNSIPATYLKIQRVGYGSLSMAEVQVFQEKVNSFAYYSYGSEIQSSPVTRPYQPVTPLDITYANVQFAGRWLLQITQDSAVAPKHNEGWSGSFGTISDWVLVITDLAGIVHTYYQDLTAEITSLPRYGKMYSAPRFTPDPYGDWREAFDVTESGQIVPTEPGKQPRGMCYGKYINIHIA